MSSAPRRRILGDVDSRTSRARLIGVTELAASDRSLASTRARLIYVVEHLQHVDKALAEALGQLLPNSTDAEHPAIRATGREGGMP